MGDAAAVEARLKSFLDSLSPEARSMLTRGVGDPAAAASSDPMLARALAAMAAAQPADAAAGPFREAFFAPILMFVTDGQPAEPQTGRIPQVSLDAFWTWISRDLRPEETRTATSADIAVLRPRILRAARDALEAARPERDRARLVGQLGGERPFRDASEIVTAFDHAGWVTAFLDSLPNPVTRADIEAGTAVTDAVAALAIERGGDLPWGLAGLMTRVESPGLMAILVNRLHGTSDIAPIASGAYGAAIDLVLAELDMLVERVRDARLGNDPQGLTAAMLAFALIDRDAEAAVDISGSQRWGGRLARLKTVISAQISDTLAQTPGLTRRILSIRGHGPAHDPAIAEDAERGLHLVVAATRARDSLAVNQLLQTVRRELDKAFEVLFPPLFDGLRRAHGPDKVYFTARVDAAIQLAAVYLGEDFAAALRRSRHAALMPLRAAISR